MHAGPNRAVSSRRTAFSPRRRIDDVDVNVINSEGCCLRVSLCYMWGTEHGIEDRGDPRIVNVPEERSIYRVLRVKHIAQPQRLGRFLAPLSGVV